MKNNKENYTLKIKGFILFLFTTLLFISISNRSNIFAIEQKKSSRIQADIPVKMMIHVFGYTAPYSIVQAQGIRIFAQTSSDRTGYFDFPQLPLSFESSDVCFTTLDAQRRIGFPTCIKAPGENESTDIGPILLSPTISLSTGVIWERQQAAVSGQTIPDSQVVISFFDARPQTAVESVSTVLVRYLHPLTFAAEIPPLIGRVDSKGNYSVNLPTVKSNQFRVFAKSLYLGLPTPKSHTLLFSVGSLFYYWLIYVFPKLFFLLLFVLISFYLIYREKKTRRGRIWLAYFNETTLIPFEIRTRLEMKRIWYTLRGLWK